DHFGDVPYSEATSGEISEGSILAPNYDNAATIYSSLVTTLDEAIADFDVAQNSDVDDDDFIYGGDLESWTRFAYSLKLRILMRTSEVDPKGSAIQTLINDGIFIETEADMPMVP